MTTKTPFREIADALSERDAILVASHVRPDGDALGSIIAFALWLKQMGKHVVAWNADGMPEKFFYLPGREMVCCPSPQPKRFDAVVALDTSTKERLGSVLAGIAQCGLWVNIDHHVSNPGYGDLNHIDPEAPATGQIIFEFLQSIGAEITPEIAANLYAAISTDTGSFQYPATTPRTFEVAAELLRRGVHIGSLSQSMYESYPLRRLQLLRELLNVARFECGGRAASFSLSLETANSLGVVPEDNEGLIDHLRAVESVIVAVFFEELPEQGAIRVSMRSKNAQIANACELCARYGGGGHPLAAGARVKGTLKDVAEDVMNVVCEEIRKND